MVYRLVMFEIPNNDDSPKVKSIQSKQGNFLINLWKRLVFNPVSFPQSHNTSISSILDEEANKLISESLKLVLSRELELPLNSEKLCKAVEASNKIFHEDFPYDFILEYKGVRLGMMILNKCNNSNGEEKLIYSFNPQIKSFRGMF